MSDLLILCMPLYVKEFVNDLFKGVLGNIRYVFGSSKLN